MRFLSRARILLASHELTRSRGQGRASKGLIVALHSFFALAGESHSSHSTTRLAKTGPRSASNVRHSATFSRDGIIVAGPFHNNRSSKAATCSKPSSRSAALSCCVVIMRRPFPVEYYQMHDLQHMQNESLTMIDETEYFTLMRFDTTKSTEQELHQSRS
jgi:hypothetical protein